MFRNRVERHRNILQGDSIRSSCSHTFTNVSLLFDFTLSLMVTFAPLDFQVPCWYIHGINLISTVYHNDSPAIEERLSSENVAFRKKVYSAVM